MFYPFRSEDDLSAREPTSYQSKFNIKVNLTNWGFSRLSIEIAKSEPFARTDDEGFAYSNEDVLQNQGQFGQMKNYEVDISLF